MKRLLDALSTLALLVILALAALLVGVRFIGLTPYSVLSGSMEPAYHTGDLIYVREIASEDIAVGLPITYVANEQLVVATHRVVEVAERITKSEPVLLEDGTPAVDARGQVITQEIPLETPVRYFLTKGDATPEAKSELVHEKNVIGTPVYRIPKLGYFVTMLKSSAGKVMSACFGLALVILMFLPEMLAAIEKREQKKNAAAPAEADAQVGEKETEDVLLCGKAQGEDVVVAEKNAAGEDVVLPEKGAAQEGEDRLVDAPKA